MTIVKGGGLQDGSSSAHGGSDFFDNKGAVAGVFVVVGLIIAGGAALFAWFMLRRRRRQRLDRDVAAAAAAAAAGHHARFDDEDEPSMSNAYNNGFYTSASSHEYDQKPQMHQYDYEDPAGGYDPYAANLVDVPPNHGERPVSTATAAGLAGFGASSAAANYYAQHPTDYSQPQQQDYSHSYGDPQYDIAHQYAVPNSSLSPVAEMSADQHHDAQYSYNQYDQNPGQYNYHEDVYNTEPHAGVPLTRPDSVGSVEFSKPRDLTVSNV